MVVIVHRKLKSNLTAVHSSNEKLYTRQLYSFQGHSRVLYPKDKRYICLR